ncbi:MAG: acyltransferase, partial [Bifidobacteriaceae bacterium]|nr:acyltransferase [Bifidobacteriaceae bacterium]
MGHRDLGGEEVGQPETRLTVRGAQFRVSGLDGLRVLAALGVLICHFVAWRSGLWLGDQPFRGGLASAGAAFGIFGVDVFFAISGVVIPITLTRQTPVSFLTARIARLFPAYWVAVLAGVGAYCLLGSGHTSLADVLINLTMMQSSAGVGDVFAAQWTLWAELRFYLLAAGLCALGVTRRRLIAAATFWAPVAALCDRTDLHFASEILVAPYSPLFAGGLTIFGLLRWGLRSCAFWLALAENVAFAAAWTGPARVRALATGTGGALDLTSGQVSVCIVACFTVVLVAALLRPSGR